MKLAHALASISLLPFGSAIDPKRIKHNLRHIESAKNEDVERVERFLADEIDSKSMAASVAETSDGGMMGGSKSQKVRRHCRGN